MIEKGFYYHYKHDSSKGIYDASYEVIGNAFDTEAGGNVHSEDPEDFLTTEVVIYRPLFADSLVYKAGRRYWVRPAKMFLEEVEKDGEKTTRFIRITDPETTKKLEEKRDEMY